MAQDHAFQPGPPPEGVTPCECDDESCRDAVMWCQECGAGEDAYQHQDDDPLYVEDILAGDTGDGAFGVN